MIIDNSVKIRNYKCFGHEEQGFEKILPLNIIIGKNNSGKSSLLDLVEFITDPSKDVIGVKNGVTKCIISLTLTESVIKEVISDYANTSGSKDEVWLKPITDHCNDRNNIVSKNVSFSIESPNEIILINNKNNYGQYEQSFLRVFNSFFKNKVFKRINAERDIAPETFYAKDSLNSNGKNATNIVWKYLAIKGYDQNLIRKDFLNNLNKITSPDIEFTDITIKEDNPDNRQVANGEIYFEYSDGTWVALSKMGSGIKTIILILLNLIVLPQSEYIKKDKLVFGFEELENNLHPSLQRRLFNYIADYTEKNRCHFFITTHSSLPIDLFSANKFAQIIHVEKRDLFSFSKTIETEFDGRNILKDLDFKASDILLSNGVIWVEGPSDALYLELLFDLYKMKKNLTSKFNYCIQALSTAIWKYAGFSDFDWDKVDNTTENQIISLAKINHNHIIIIDNDNNYEDKKPSEFKYFSDKMGQNKARLLNESMKFGNYLENQLENNYGDSKDGKLFFWVNKGTFETYLEYFIKNKGEGFKKYFDLKASRGYFEKKRTGDNYSKSKVELASEIASFSLKNNLVFEDIAPPNSELENKIQRLFETIKYWNS